MTATRLTATAAGPTGSPRSWPRGPGVGYANLAVRGRLTARIKAERLASALALRPDLVTVMAGMNDLVRPGFDAAGVARDIEDMFSELTAAGARVAR